MGVFDDIKDSIPGKDSDSGSSGKRNFSDSSRGMGSEPDLGGGNRREADNPGGTGFGASSRSQSDGGKLDGTSQNLPGNAGQDPLESIGGNDGQRSSNPGNNGKQIDNRGNNAGERVDSGGRQGERREKGPNAQAGRPRKGNSNPQLSSSTRRKMENTGMDAPETGRNTSKVSESRSDMEEIKSQNEQIIELLKRIESGLNNGGRHQSRRR